MKTLYILTAFLGLQFNTIFAAGNFSDSPVSVYSLAYYTVLANLAPATPAEATFEEVMVADFLDEAPATETNIATFAPVMPKEADFEDEPENATTAGLDNIAPVAPANADFEDCV